MGVFGKIDLTGETHTLPAGRYTATITDARVVKNRDEDALWLFITIDAHTDDGEALGQVEDKFITIASKEGSHAHSRLREGLKKLALYGIACGVDLNGKEPEEIPGLLTGNNLKAVISRRGVGVQAENRVVAVLPVCE